MAADPIDAGLGSLGKFCRPSGRDESVYPRGVFVLRFDQLAGGSVQVGAQPLQPY